MRHRIKGRKLNRTASHKKALIRNLANQLFEHKEIRTTTAKAKEARVTIERLITYAKKGDTHHRRLAFGFLRQKDTIKTLFNEIAPTYTERQGGYTRVIKLGRRQGDGAPMAILQLFGFETLADITTKPEKKKKTRKREEKPVETDSKVKEVKEPEVKEASVGAAAIVGEEPAESAGEQVEEVKAVEESKDIKDDESAEEAKPAEEVKVEEDSKSTEEKEAAEEVKPAEEEKSAEETKSAVEEEPAKEESDEKPAEESKADDAESGEEKKDK
jgi:large subunit ribosomal protein L17